MAPLAPVRRGSVERREAPVAPVRSAPSQPNATIGLAPIHVEKKPLPKLVFVGIGQDSKLEAKAMASVLPEGTVEYMGGNTDNDAVTVNGVRFDLRSASGRQAFVDNGFTPPLAADQKACVLEALGTGWSGFGARDEVAQMALTWHDVANSGGTKTLDHLVISGHSYGGSIWNRQNGTLEMKSIGSLCKAFPKVAAQVKTVFFAACNHLHPKNLREAQQWFPNLQSAGGYRGTAPATNIGGAAQAKAWAELVQEGKTPITLAMVREKLAAMRATAKTSNDLGFYAECNAINIATWNKTDNKYRDFVSEPPPKRAR